MPRVKLKRPTSMFLPGFPRGKAYWPPSARTSWPARQPSEQRQLGTEDERVVQVHDVECGDPRDAGDERRVADGEQRLDAMDECAAWVGRLALGRGGEDLDVVAALGLSGCEAVAGVSRAARIRREGRRQMGDPQAGGR